ncbi:hypothetical protein BVY02_00640 [bacterium J17]|nr:hypothetical protein BVY02_00640 [bacterium J17]
MEINSANSLGFIDPKSNKVRSKKELQKQEARAPERNPAGADAVKAEVTDNSVRSAIIAVKGRARNDVNKVADRLNSATDDLKAGRENIKQLGSTARELRTAIKDGDEERAEELRGEFSQLISERREIAARTEQNNEGRGEEISIRVGNESRGSFIIERVEIPQPPEVDTRSEEGITQFLRESENELGNIRTQLNSQREQRQALSEINRDTQDELSSISNDSEQEVSRRVGSFREANNLANDIASRLGAQVALEQSVVNNIDEALVQSLVG